MELRVLKYFLMVAREQNITRAAQLLHITQPTLSRQLMQLEAELGTKLFHRGRHNITLTEQGILLKRRAFELVTIADKTMRELSPEDGIVSGDLSFGCGESRGMHLLSKCMHDLHERHPLVHFDLYSGMADDIKERIDNGLLDFGLLMEPVDISKYDFLRLPQTETWGIWMCDDHPLAQKELIAPTDLIGIPLLIAKRERVQNEFASWFGTSYEKLTVVATYNLFYNAALMVMNQMGVAVSFAFECTFDKLCFRPLTPTLETGCVLVWKKHQPLSKAMQQFLQQLKDTI